MMLLLDVILAFILLQTVTCQTPSISYISPRQIKEIGSSVEMNCSVQNANNFSVLWSKPSPETVKPLLLSNGTTLIVQDSRFGVRYDPSSSTYTLQIKDIQEMDTGTYLCQIIIASNKSITDDAEMWVRTPPVISDDSTKSLVVTEGQSIQLECNAGGYPTPRVFWQRGNRIRLPTGTGIFHHILRIKSIRKEDGGTYYCMAENGVGQRAMRNMNVHVVSANENTDLSWLTRLGCWFFVPEGQVGMTYGAYRCGQT